MLLSATASNIIQVQISPSDPYQKDQLQGLGAGTRINAVKELYDFVFDLSKGYAFEYLIRKSNFCLIFNLSFACTELSEISTSTSVSIYLSHPIRQPSDGPPIDCCCSMGCDTQAALPFDWRSPGVHCCEPGSLFRFIHFPANEAF